MADIGERRGVEFPALGPAQSEGLRAALGPKVALANPLDYNTYIWGDEAALAACFTALCQGDIALGCVVVDFPRSDRFEAPDYDMVIRAAKLAGEVAGKPMALVSLLAEGLSEDVADRAISAGVVPLCGMGEALGAIRAAADVATARNSGPAAAPSRPILLPGPDGRSSQRTRRGSAPSTAMSAIRTASLRRRQRWRMPSAGRISWSTMPASCGPGRCGTCRWPTGRRCWR